MKITDRIYGEIQIKDQIIIDLIGSSPFQRLKNISQDGASHFIQPVRNVTRYEHSIGVWHLSNLFECPIEEQIAALLHDIPHTAFSHVIDFVVEDKNHEYHDKFTKQIILDSEIPQILKENNINIDKVLNKEDYILLDNNLPDISLDRLDYFLRDSFMFGIMPQDTVNLILHSLKVKDKKFYFDDHRIAAMYAVMFLNSSRLIWLDPTSHGSYFLLANALKLGLKKGNITEEDFFDDDHTLMDKLKKTNDNEILSLLERLQPGKEFVYEIKEKAEFYGPNKPRFVDPWVMKDGKLVHLSEIVPGMQNYFDEFTEKYKNIGVRQLD